MRNAMIWATAALAAQGVATAQTPPAETNVRIAINRIGEVEAQLHSIIALDPTAIDQARAVDDGKLRGPLAGQPVMFLMSLRGLCPPGTHFG